MTLVRRLWLGALELTDYPYALEFGSDYGNPENVGVVMESLLADGEIESLTRRSNRTLSIPIQVQGADLAEIHANEAALIAECDLLQNTVTIDPGDDFAVKTVFRSFAAQANRVMGDGDDQVEMAGLHRWVLTIKALPFGFSESETVDDAGTPPSDAGTLLDNCESPTGWSMWRTPYGSHTGTSITVDNAIYMEGAGSIKAQSVVSYTADSTSWQFSNYDQVSGLSLDTDTGGYLSIRIRTFYTDKTTRLAQLWMTIDGVETEVTNFIAASRDADGWVRYVWPVEAGATVTGLRFWVIQYQNSDVDTGGWAWYDDIELLPSATTDHQIVKQHAVLGSARTTGSLQISSPTETIALGKVLAITTPTSAVPAGFQPDGARWVTQGTTTADASALDGIYYTPSTTTYDDSAGKPIFDVPVGMLTAGPYMMVSLVKVETSPTVAGVQAQLLVDGTEVGATSTAEVSIPNLATGWTFIPIGTVDMPPTPVQNADDTTKVRLLFKGAKMANIYFIPAWEVGGLPVADYSIVDCGTGTVGPGLASSSLFLDAPSVTQPQGAIWRGPTTNRANSQSAWPDALVPGVHKFPPGSLTNFVVSLGAAGPTSTLRYFAAHYMMATS